MDVFDNPVELVSLASTLLLLLLSTHRSLQLVTAEESEDKPCRVLERLREYSEASSLDENYVTRAALHSFRLWSCVHLLEDDLGYWVKPRLTTWFSRFLLEQYDEDRWVKMFRMTKASVFSLAELLKPTIQKKNTKYRLAIPVVVRLACKLFKLTHGASLLICSEMFAMGRSSVSMLLRQVVHAINDVLCSEISWPRGEKLVEIEAHFQQLCGLPGVVGAIDGTHVAILKPKFGPVDYYYFKSGGYSVNCQAVVDSQKRFLDLFLGMPGSTNDSRVLRRSSLYQKATDNTLWDARVSFTCFTPYLLGDSGYPLMSWLMVPHHQHANLPVADSLFNRKLRRGRGVVENAFVLLKQSFRELMVKSDLHVTFLPDVITCCAILHNMLLRQSYEDVERLLHVLRTEGFTDDMEGDVVPHAELHDTVGEEDPQQQGIQKCRDLGVHLALQRVLPL